jgi:hypothetical protein
MISAISFTTQLYHSKLVLQRITTELIFAAISKTVHAPRNTAHSAFLTSLTTKSPFLCVQLVCIPELPCYVDHIALGARGCLRQVNITYRGTKYLLGPFPLKSARVFFRDSLHSSAGVFYSPVTPLKQFYTANRCDHDHETRRKQISK